VSIQQADRTSVAISLELPFSVVKRTDVPSAEPTRNTVKMEGVIANAPCNVTFLVVGCGLVGLTFDAQVHDVIAANGARIDNNVPRP